LSTLQLTAAAARAAAATARGAAAVAGARFIMYTGGAAGLQR
jgi:hypothetical protein